MQMCRDAQVIFCWTQSQTKLNAQWVPPFPQPHTPLPPNNLYLMHHTSTNAIVTQTSSSKHNHSYVHMMIVMQASVEYVCPCSSAQSHLAKAPHSMKTLIVLTTFIDCMAEYSTDQTLCVILTCQSKTV